MVAILARMCESSRQRLRLSSELLPAEDDSARPLSQRLVGDGSLKRLWQRPELFEALEKAYKQCAPSAIIGMYLACSLCLDSCNWLVDDVPDRRQSIVKPLRDGFSVQSNLFVRGQEVTKEYSKTPAPKGELCRAGWIRACPTSEGSTWARSSWTKMSSVSFGCAVTLQSCLLHGCEVLN